MSIILYSHAKDSHHSERRQVTFGAGHAPGGYHTVVGSRYCRRSLSGKIRTSEAKQIGLSYHNSKNQKKSSEIKINERQEMKILLRGRGSLSFFSRSVLPFLNTSYAMKLN